jgi:hypothetical protein
MISVITSQETARWRNEYFPEVTDVVWTDVVDGPEGVKAIKSYMPVIRDLRIWKLLKMPAEREAAKHAPSLHQGV